MKKVILAFMLLSFICAFYSCDSDSDDEGSSGKNNLSETQLASYGTHNGRKLAYIEYREWDDSHCHYEFKYNDKGIISRIECTNISKKGVSSEILESYTFSERLDTLVRDRRSSTPKLYTYVLNYDKKGRVTNLRTVKSSDYEHNITATFSYDGNGNLKSYNSSFIEWENGCPIKAAGGDAVSREISDPTGYSMEFIYDEQTENKYDIYCKPFFALTDDDGFTHSDIKPLDILSVLGMLGNAPSYLPSNIVGTRNRGSSAPDNIDEKYSYNFNNDNSGFGIYNKGNLQQIFIFK